MSTCPCGSGLAYSDCCEPYHLGQPAPTPESLMRSRYSAFVFHNLDYVEATSTEEAAATFARSTMEASLPDTKWLGLDIGEVTETETEATVRFSFRYSYKGRDQMQVEIARFVRTDGIWRYDSSEVNPKSAPVRVIQIGRNDPCPCGSGKKYKKCCGA